MVQHQWGAHPTAQFRRRSASQLLQRARRLGEPLRWPARLYARLQRRDGQPLLRDAKLGQQEGSLRVHQLHVEYTQSGRGIYGTDNYAVPNTEALKLVSPAIVDLLPTSPKLKDKVYLKDDAWWAANLAKATTKFKEWQLAG